MYTLISLERIQSIPSFTGRQTLAHEVAEWCGSYLFRGITFQILSGTSKCIKYFYVLNSNCVIDSSRTKISCCELNQRQSYKTWRLKLELPSVIISRKNIINRWLIDCLSRAKLRIITFECIMIHESWLMTHVFFIKNILECFNCFKFI